jgi:hypothetical protein
VAFLDFASIAAGVAGGAALKYWLRPVGSLVIYSAAADQVTMVFLASVPYLRVRWSGGRSDDVATWCGERCSHPVQA